MHTEVNPKDSFRRKSVYIIEQSNVFCDLVFKLNLSFRFSELKFIVICYFLFVICFNG